MVPLAFVIGCRSAAPDPQERPPASTPVVEAGTPEAAAPTNPAPSAAAAEEGPRQIGHFNVTLYYVVGEDEVPARRPRKTQQPANENAVGSGGSGTAVASASSGSAEGAGSAGGGAVVAAGSDPDGSASMAGAGSGSDAAALAAVEPPDLVTLYGHEPSCPPIARTSREFAFELAIQGTGKLRDGRVLNIWGACNCPKSPCFKVTEQQWGTGGGGRPLQPFRTVAVDPRLIKLGTLLYIPLLEGRTMPGRPPWGGFVHDGCVLADDTGGAIRGLRLDLFVGRRGWLRGMAGPGGSHSWLRHIPVFDGSKICERKGRQISRRSGAI